MNVHNCECLATLQYIFLVVRRSLGNKVIALIYLFLSLMIVHRCLDDKVSIHCPTVCAELVYVLLIKMVP